MRKVCRNNQKKLHASPTVKQPWESIFQRKRRTSAAEPCPRFQVPGISVAVAGHEVVANDEATGIGRDEPALQFHTIERREEDVLVGHAELSGRLRMGVRMDFAKNSASPFMTWLAWVSLMVNSPFIDVRDRVSPRTVKAA